MHNALLNWNSIFDTGNDAIDIQHKKLFKLLKEFNQACNVENNKQAITLLLFNLEDYTKVHFFDEEQLLSKKAGLPTDEHVRQHEEFIKYLADLKFDYVSENKNIENELFIFLTNWLKDHILNIDQKELNQLNQ